MFSNKRLRNKYGRLQFQEPKKLAIRQIPLPRYLQVAQVNWNANSVDYMIASLIIKTCHNQFACLIWLQSDYPIFLAIPS